MWHPTYAALRDGTPHAIVVNDLGDLHPEACQFLMGMTLAGKAHNTGRAYSRGITKFLNWTQAEGLDWRAVTILNLARFRRWFETTPTTHHRPPSASTLSVSMVGVTQFLRYCAHEGLIGSWVAEQLIQPALIGSTIDRGDPSANRLNSRLRVTVPEQPVPALPFPIMDALRQRPMRPRTDFLVRLLWCTGCRIGEALSAWREDIHTLPSNLAAGCPIEGPHIHLGRRYDQPRNRAKTGPRIVPLDEETVTAYDRYLDWRFRPTKKLSTGVRVSSPALDGRHLFVVSQGDTVNQPLHYDSVIEAFRKFDKHFGCEIRPHMIRHTRATWWVRHGVDLDVVRDLLGHSSITTTQKYLHATTDEMRAAVDLLA